VIGNWGLMLFFAKQNLSAQKGVDEMTQAYNLSKREKEVAELLLRGKSNKQIALALGISKSTVEFHLKNVYAKLRVSSRVEAILKLGKSTGLIGENLRESVVERTSKNSHTGGISILRKGAEMKNRWSYYFLAGLIFGAAYWHYFSVTARFLNNIFINVDVENKSLMIWMVLSVSFLVYFGVWLLPAILPAVYEFRRSGKVRLSVSAVIVMWVSAVFGYYLTYVVLLAFVGLPNMEYFLVFGQRGPTFWQDWAELFPRLIFFKFLKWTVVGLMVGGFTGLVTSSLYSLWIKKTDSAMPA
jgi:DNA-binding CsgD family transcriptional regulator